MTRVGYNFRATIGYVTDGSGETFVDESAYSSERGFGWFGTATARNRNTGWDRRLAACHFNNATSTYWRLDLPNGPGSYRIWAGFFDLKFANGANWLLRDGTTTFKTISGSVIGSVHGDISGFDADGASMSPDAWASADGGQSIDHTFVNDHLRVQVNTTSNNVISHIAVEFLGGGSVIQSRRRRDLGGYGI